MALGGTQSGVLQQLEVSYLQVLDYSLKEYAATLVGSALTCKGTVQLS